MIMMAWNWAIEEKQGGIMHMVLCAVEWAQPDLNRRPSGYEPDAPPD